MRPERHKFQRASRGWSGAKSLGRARPRPRDELSDFANARSGYGVSPENPHVPLFAAGLALRPDAPVLAFIQADVAFHTALYRLSGNRAIEDTVSAQWPHLKRSMGTVLEDAEQELQAAVADDELAVVLEPYLRLDGDRGQGGQIWRVQSGTCALRSPRWLHT